MTEVLYVIAALVVLGVVLYAAWKVIEHLGKDRYTPEDIDFVNSYAERKQAAREALGTCHVSVRRTPMKRRNVWGRLYYSIKGEHG